MQVVLITDTYFETDPGGAAVAVFEAGRQYPLTEATQRQVALGNATIVEVPDADTAEAAPRSTRSGSVKRQTDAAAPATSAG